MTKEDKDLLLKDLCARVPYGVVVNISYNKENGSSDRLRLCSEGDLPLNADLLNLFIEQEIFLKPYLRPMSSMTEEERKYIIDECCIHETILPGGISHALMPALAAKILINFYNKKHLDFNGLIQNGLAIEVTEDNNPYL